MSLANREGKIWLDGKLVDWREAKIHVLSHTLHYGTGIFEGVRCYESKNGPAIFRLTAHTRRLFQSAHILGIKIPFSEEEITSAQCEVVHTNDFKSCYIRPLVFYGANTLGLGATDNPVQVAIAAWPWGTYLGEEGLQKGIRVHTATYARHHVNTAMCLAKATGYYVNSVLAHDEAVKNGYDEALMLDVNGLAAEGPGENLFIVRNGKIITPALTSQLEGITRDTIIQLAADLGYDVIERAVTRDAVYTADEAFFTGTAAEVTPIRELDNRTIGNGDKGTITAALQEAFFECVRGQHKRSPEWLTPIN